MEGRSRAGSPFSIAEGMPENNGKRPKNSGFWPLPASICQLRNDRRTRLSGLYTRVVHAAVRSLDLRQ